MKHIDQVISSPYKGSIKTYELVREQLRERYGNEVADTFDPVTDCMPILSWARFNYRVKPKEKALKTITILEVKDAKGRVTRKIRRTINLFHKNQVEKVA